MLALDLRPERAILAVVDLSGRFLSRETVMTVSDPKRAIIRIVERMRALRERHADKSFEGIGVSVPGRVHPVTQRLLLAPNLKWHDFDLKRALKKELNLQVEIDNDANACLLSELWYGRLEGVQNAVLVAISEGIGTAFSRTDNCIPGTTDLRESSVISLSIPPVRSVAAASMDVGRCTLFRERHFTSMVRSLLKRRRGYLPAAQTGRGRQHCCGGGGIASGEGFGQGLRLITAALAGTDSNNRRDHNLLAEIRPNRSEGTRKHDAGRSRTSTRDGGRC